MKDFQLTILEPGRFEVLLESAAQAIPWEVVDTLDRAGIRVITALSSELSTGVADLAAGCSGVIATNSSLKSIAGVLPRLDVSAACGAALTDFVAAVQGGTGPTRSYAFFLGRLERAINPSENVTAAYRSTFAALAGLDTHSKAAFQELHAQL